MEEEGGNVKFAFKRALEILADEMTFFVEKVTHMEKSHLRNFS